MPLLSCAGDARYHRVVNHFDLAAILIGVAALTGYFNRRILNLPMTSGTLAVALVSSFAIVGASILYPGVGIEQTVTAFLGEVDFNETLMHGMLSFLLFAGALQVDLEGLLEHKWTIGLLATFGVFVSAAIVGLLTWWMFGLFGIPVRFLVCLTLGAIISPTDPIAVLGLLKELRAPRSLEAQIAGESLFNDGIGVVLFLAVVQQAGLGIAAAPLRVADLAVFVLREVGGGTVIGLVFGYVAYRALKSLDDHPLELLITLALAMCIYSLSFSIHVSGPIAVVVAGLLIGNPGRKFAMSARTREHVDAFWEMIDQILNSVLFLLIALELFAVPRTLTIIGAAAVTIPIALAARLAAVSAPVGLMAVLGRQFMRGIVPVLTWSGLRGGISVAMVLSLPPFPERELLVGCVYAVVVFSILVQGLSVRRVLMHYHLAETVASAV